MNDIFISYATADKDKAQLLAEAFTRQGWSVWYDRAIPPGKSFDETIENALNSARCILVLWSKASVSSRWVKTEAAEGAARGILVPALIEKVQIPLEFRRIQAADLSDWQGDSPHFEFDHLLQTIAGIVRGTAPTRVDPIATNEKMHLRPWWKTAPGILTATVGVIAVVIGLIFVLQQTGLFDGREEPLRQSRGETGSTPSETAGTPVVPKPAAPAPRDRVPSVTTATPSTQAINLLSPESGGHVIAATNDQWLYTINGDEKNWQYIDTGITGAWAVYGFKDDVPATFDTFKVLILDAASWNLKEFELLAGNDSANGKFDSIGKFQTQNFRFFKDPYQEFRFPAVKAKHLKIKVISSHGFSAVGVYEFQLLGAPER